MGIWLGVLGLGFILSVGSFLISCVPSAVTLCFDKLYLISGTTNITMISPSKTLKHAFLQFLLSITMTVHTATYDDDDDDDDSYYYYHIQLLLQPSSL